MRNLILITLFITSIALDVNAQERENTTMLEFKTKSVKLTSATGWEKNKTTGKWIENKNVIDDKKSTSYQFSDQGFKWLQFSTITKNGKDYYVFLWETINHQNKRTHFFVLTTEQYDEIKTQIDLKTGKNIIVKSEMTGNITDKYKSRGGEHLYNEENLLARITNTMEEPLYSEDCFMLNTQTIDGVDILRFRLPEDCYSSEEDIKTKYFEVKISEFKAILTE